MLPRYTYGTPFAHKELVYGKLLLTFVLYVNTWLSIRAIARLFDHDYHTIHDAVDDFEIAFIAGFPRVWEAIKPCVGGPTQVDETPQVCSGFTGQEPPREGLDPVVIHRLIVELIPTVPHEPGKGYFICSVNTGNMVNLVSVG